MCKIDSLDLEIPKKGSTININNNTFKSILFFFYKYNMSVNNKVYYLYSEILTTSNIKYSLVLYSLGWDFSLRVDYPLIFPLVNMLRRFPNFIGSELIFNTTWEERKKDKNNRFIKSDQMKDDWYGEENLEGG
jgi:hypothetical protein